MTLIPRRYPLIGLFLFLQMLVTSENAIAQAPAPAALPSNSQVQTKPMYVQGAVVVLLMAAAVYGVCRSSRRV